MRPNPALGFLFVVDVVLEPIEMLTTGDDFARLGHHQRRKVRILRPVAVGYADAVGAEAVIFPVARTHVVCGRRDARVIAEPCGDSLRRSPADNLVMVGWHENQIHRGLFGAQLNDFDVSRHRVRIHLVQAAVRVLRCAAGRRAALVVYVDLVIPQGDEDAPDAAALGLAEKVARPLNHPMRRNLAIVGVASLALYAELAVMHVRQINNKQAFALWLGPWRGICRDDALDALQPL